MKKFNPCTVESIKKSSLRYVFLGNNAAKTDLHKDSDIFLVEFKTAEEYFDFVSCCYTSEEVEIEGIDTSSISTYAIFPYYLVNSLVNFISYNDANNFISDIGKKAEFIVTYLFPDLSDTSKQQLINANVSLKRSYYESESLKNVDGELAAKLFEAKYLLTSNYKLNALYLEALAPYEGYDYSKSLVDSIDNYIGNFNTLEQVIGVKQDSYNNLSIYYNRLASFVISNFNNIFTVISKNTPILTSSVESLSQVKGLIESFYSDSKMNKEYSFSSEEDFKELKEVMEICRPILGNIYCKENSRPVTGMNSVFIRNKFICSNMKININNEMSYFYLLNKVNNTYYQVYNTTDKGVSSNNNPVPSFSFMFDIPGAAKSNYSNYNLSSVLQCVNPLKLSEKRTSYFIECDISFGNEFIKNVGGAVAETLNITDFDPTTSSETFASSKAPLIFREMNGECRSSKPSELKVKLRKRSEPGTPTEFIDGYKDNKKFITYKDKSGHFAYVLKSDKAYASQLQTMKSRRISESFKGVVSQVVSALICPYINLNNHGEYSFLPESLTPIFCDFHGPVVNQSAEIKGVPGTNMSPAGASFIPANFKNTLASMLNYSKKGEKLTFDFTKGADWTVGKDYLEVLSLYKKDLIDSSKSYLEGIIENIYEKQQDQILGFDKFMGLLSTRNASQIITSQGKLIFSSLFSVAIERSGIFSGSSSDCHFDSSLTKNTDTFKTFASKLVQNNLAADETEVLKGILGYYYTHYIQNDNSNYTSCTYMSSFVTAQNSSKNLDLPVGALYMLPTDNVTALTSLVKNVYNYTSFYTWYKQYKNVIVDSYRKMVSDRISELNKFANKKIILTPTQTRSWGSPPKLNLFTDSYCTNFSYQNMHKISSMFSTLWYLESFLEDALEICSKKEDSYIVKEEVKEEASASSTTDTSTKKKRKSKQAATEEYIKALLAEDAEEASTSGETSSE